MYICLKYYFVLDNYTFDIDIFVYLRIKNIELPVEYNTFTKAKLDLYH